MRSRDQRKKGKKRKPKTRFDDLGKSFVIDFYPQGKSLSHRRFEDYNPLVVVVTVEKFHFFDVVLTVGSNYSIGEDLLLSPRNRNILRIIQIRYNQLSSSALNNLPTMVRKIVEASESRYINFLNKAHPLTSQMHQLQLLPGIGQKRLWAILEARKSNPFSSFSDFSTRTNISDPMSIFTKRILLELKNSPKYYLFTNKSQ
jgi:putative nucleotide binding protein